MMASLFSRLRFRERLLPIVLSQAVGLICGMVGVHFTTRLIAPEDFGKYGIFLSFTPLGIWVFHAGLIKWVGRHWAHVHQPREALRSVAKPALRTLPWLVVASYALSWLSSHEGVWSTGSLVALSAVLLSVAYLSQAGLQATRRHWPDFGVTSLGATSRTALPLLLYLMVPSLVTLQLGFVLHTLVFAGAGLLFLRLDRLSEGANPPFREIYGGRLFLSLAIAHGALTGMNRWISGAYFQDNYTGWFTLASNIASIPTSMFGVIIGQWFQPDLYAQAGETREARRRLAKRVDLIALGYTLASFAGLWLLRHGLEAWAGGFIAPKYREALPLVVPAGAFTVAIFIGQFYQTLLLASHREHRCGWVDLPAAALLATGAVLCAALGGTRAFELFLVASPLIPWLYNRTMARRFLWRDSTPPS